MIQNNMYIFILVTALVQALCIRVPPIPCPSVFTYFKDSRGAFYGEIIIPYDNATDMTIIVNSSIIGYFNTGDLTMELVTDEKNLQNFTKFVTYNVYFPFVDPIPRITSINYNGISYCSGPLESLVPNGRTSMWCNNKFKVLRPQPQFVETSISEENIVVKDPLEKHKQQRPWIQVSPKTDWNLSEKTQSHLTESSSDFFSLINNLFPSPKPQTFVPYNDNTIDVPRCGVPFNESSSYSVELDNTNQRQFPWLVALFVNNGSRFVYNNCSANLISKKHVLTAARCIKNSKIKVENIFLIMGNGFETRKIRHVDVPSAFNMKSQSAHADIAIITMDQSVAFSDFISPVCLWKGSTDIYPLANKMGILASYGQDLEKKASVVLRTKTKDLPIVSQEECFTSPLGFENIISDRTFCTKTSDGRLGPCLGNSGAGFFIFINGAYYLRGIISGIYQETGICDKSCQYSVFSDVAKFLDWIKPNMR